MLSHYPPSSAAAPVPSKSRQQLSHLTTSQLSDALSDLSQSTIAPSSSGAKTAAFFSSPFTPSASPPSPPSPSLPTSRSLNTNFFAVATSFDARPTPPPSIRSISTGPSPPPSRASSPPRLLARLFPSRHTSVHEPHRHQNHKSEIEPEQPRSPLLSPTYIPSSPSSTNGDIEQTPRPDFTPRPDLQRTPRTESTAPLLPGTVITDADPPVRLTLIRTLGQGAFSAVWLSRGSVPDPRTDRRRRRRTVTPLDGTRPVVAKRKPKEGSGLARNVSSGSSRSVYLEAESGVDDADDGDEDGEGEGRLVAVKLTPRSDDRTRVAFVREAEILRHISHPSIVRHLASFSTPAYHVLALEHLPGGDLFSVVESDAVLDERVVRRMWGELAGAVAWMHGVGLVHRDIKLENILLTASISTPPAPPRPLIKLSDFGLARFIDPSSPLLTTRCGSEAYAAPELVTASDAGYDGRKSDAWACGVVLYALAVRAMPFGEREEGVRREGGTGASAGSGRRRWLGRIARGEWSWPEARADGDGRELVGSRGLRGVVGRLLVRNVERRADVGEVGWWYIEGEEDEGQDGYGSWTGGKLSREPSEESLNGHPDGAGSGGEEEDSDDESEGHIVDREGIPSIVKQEVV